MSIKELFYLIHWDMKINHGWSFDYIRARLMLLDIRLEQFVHRNCVQRFPFLKLFWFVFRFFGSIFQWFICNSNIPGTITIGRGLRLPHPQNIILAGYADIGEFCTIYHNVSVAWNGFRKVKPNSPKIGSRVMIGTGSIIVGDICIGTDVLIGAGSLIVKSVPDHSRVLSRPAEVSLRPIKESQVEPGSAQHIQDPYSIWR